MALFPGTPKLESRNCPETVPVGVPGLWELITPDCRVWSQWGLNQSCSPRRDLSNAVLHSQFEGREELDSRLLVAGSQTASLTPGPSFAHNLGCKCPNCQYEAILDIYASTPFQWHQEQIKARCFGLCCRILNIREFRRTPNLHLWEWEFHPPTSPKVGLRQLLYPVSSVSTRGCIFWNYVSPKVTNHLVALYFSLGELLNHFFSLSQYIEAMHAMVQCLEMVCVTIEEGSHAPSIILSSLHVD
jgi:hypothetical protein